MSKRLVTYFFASGVTAKVAENLADAIGADIFEIQLKVSYTKADLNWMDKKVRSTIEMSDPASRPAIAAKRDNIAEYDTIFVGYSSVKYSVFPQPPCRYRSSRFHSAQRFHIRGRRGAIVYIQRYAILYHIDVGIVGVQPFIAGYISSVRNLQERTPILS